MEAVPVDRADLLVPELHVPGRGENRERALTGAPLVGGREVVGDGQDDRACSGEVAELVVEAAEVLGEADGPVRWAHRCSSKTLRALPGRAGQGPTYRHSGRRHRWHPLGLEPARARVARSA